MTSIYQVLIIICIVWQQIHAIKVIPIKAIQISSEISEPEPVSETKIDTNNVFDEYMKYYDHKMDKSIDNVKTYAKHGMNELLNIVKNDVIPKLQLDGEQLVSTFGNALQEPIIYPIYRKLNKKRGNKHLHKHIKHNKKTKHGIHMGPIVGRLVGTIFSGMVGPFGPEIGAYVGTKVEDNLIQ